MSGPHMLKLDTKPSPDSSGSPSLIDPLPKTESGDVPYEHLESLHVDLTSKGMLKLYVVWIIAFQATFLAGYSIAGMTAINAMPTFQRYFDFDGLGVNVGLVFSMWPIAACLTFWAGPILADRLGRRGGMFVCALIFLAGTAMIAGAKNLGMLLAGRFLCGSMGMMQPSSAPYIVELSPPHARGMLTGLFNVCFGELDSAVTWDELTDIVIGQIVCTCISIGTSNIKSDWAWRSILVIQLAIPAIMASAVLFLPESPRWLYANGQREKAQAVLMKYHGNGELTALVRLEMRQIGDSVATMPKRWDYGTLFKTRSARYRVMLALFMAVAQQLSGQGLNHFLPVIYKQVGVTSVQKQLIMTLIAAIVTLVAALLGTYNSDRLGRRKMLIGGTFLCALALTGAMISSAYAHVNTDGSTVRGENFNSAASKASIAFLILLGACYGWGYMPLLPLYPSEVLRTEQRSTGMGLVVLGVNLASFINQFLIPIALKQIGWWTYLPFIIWVCIETVLWYLFAVETKGRTLEELDDIFDSPKPVKASLLARNHQHKPSDVTKPHDLEKVATGAPLQVAVSGGP